MTYKTSHDLARMMRQSPETARRVLREVWPGRTEPDKWKLREEDWMRVLLYLEHGKSRFGGRRRRGGKRKRRVMTDLDALRLDLGK